MAMYSEDDVLVNGEIKLELDTSEAVHEAVCPIVIEPVVPAVVDGPAQCRRSGRTAKKRSLLLPGELEADVATRLSTFQCILPRPEPSGDNVGDADENTCVVTIPRVSEVKPLEVKPEALPPRKKRICRSRKSQEPTTSAKNPPAGAENIDELLGQLVTVYCGNESHPDNCQDCQNRIEVIRALLQSSGQCRHDASASDDSIAVPSVSADNQEPDGANTVCLGLFSCAKCSDRFDTFDELQKHNKEHSADKKQCKVCHRRLAANSSMTLHMRTHSGEKPFRCEDCGVSFAAGKTLREHRFKHTGERPHRCMQCGRGFSRKSILKVHLRYHTGELPYVCSVCGKGFALSGLLKKHGDVHSEQRAVRTPHPRKPRPADSKDQVQTCPDCGKTLSGRSSMKAHRFLHTGDRPFVCSICSQSFTRYQHLLDHSDKHTGSRRHVCEECGAQFSRVSSLRVHRRLHTGETPYTCEICGVAFAQSSNLTQHTRSHHTHEKPFACSFCGEQFMWSKNRILHERRYHTHEKPFSCDVCGRQFLTKYQLRLHDRSKHSSDESPANVLHHCSHCAATFIKKSSLVRHIRKHFNYHGNEEESSAMADEEQMCGNSMPSDDDYAQPKDEVGLRNSHQTAQKYRQHESKVTKSTRNDSCVTSGKSRQHYCPHCQLSFSTLATLSRHVRTHFSVSDSEDEQADEKQFDEEHSSTDNEQAS